MYDYNQRRLTVLKRKKQKRKQILLLFILIGIITTLSTTQLTAQQTNPTPKVIAQITQTPTKTPVKPSVTPVKQEIEQKEVEVSVTPIPTVTAQPSVSSEVVGTGNVIEGHVSHYSRAGCLGCDPNFIMANGQPLDDNAMTIAVVPGTLPMGTKVKLTNTDNGKEVIAEVTDTGGFAKYNRVADLTVGVGNALGTKTDQSIVKIEVLQ